MMNVAIKIICIFLATSWTLVSIADCESPFTKQLKQFTKTDDLEEALRNYTGPTGLNRLANKLDSTPIDTYNKMKNMYPKVFPLLSWQEPNKTEDTTHSKMTSPSQINSKNDKIGIGEPIPHIILKVSEGKTLAPPSSFTKEYAKALNGPIGLNYSKEQGFTRFAEEHFYGDEFLATKHLITVLKEERWKQLGWIKLRKDYMKRHSISPADLLTYFQH